MLTSNVDLMYQGILFQDFLWIFFLDSFLIQPTNPISGNAFDAKQRKGGMALKPAKDCSEAFWSYEYEFWLNAFSRMLEI